MKFRPIFAKFVIFFLVVFSAVEFLWLFALPALLNRCLDENFLLSYLNKNQNIEAKIKNIAYKTYPSLTIGVSADVVDVSCNSEKVLSATSVFIKVRALPLLLGKISFGRVYADSLQVDITRSKDGTFNIKNLISNNKMKYFTPEFKNFSAELSNYQITLLDYFVSQNTVFKGNYINIKKFVPNKELSLQGDGLVASMGLKSFFDLDFVSDLPISKSFSDKEFRLNGSVSNFNFLLFKKYLPETYKDYKGTLSLSAKTVSGKSGNTFKVFARLKDFNVSQDDALNGIFSDISADLKLIGGGSNPDVFGKIYSNNLLFLFKNNSSVKSKVSADFNGQTFSLKMLCDFAKGGLLDVSGSSEIYSDKNSQYKIKSFGNIDLKLLRGALIPISKLFNLKLGILTSIKMEGLCSGDLVAKGTRDNPITDGVIKFWNSKIILDALGGELNNASGEMKFKGKELSVSTNRAFLGRSYPAKLSGKGIFNGKSEYSVSADTVDINILMGFVQKGELLNSNLSELTKIKKISGNSSLLLTFMLDDSGLKAKPDNDMQYKIKLGLKGIDVLIDGFNRQITSLFGDIELADNSLNFKLNGRILNSFFDLSGEKSSDKIKFKLSSKRTFLKDTFSIFVEDDFYKNILMGLCTSSPYLKYELNYDGAAGEINPNKIVLDAILFSKDDFGKAHQAGKITLANSKISFEDVVLSFLNSYLKVDGEVFKCFSQAPQPSLDVSFNNLDLSVLNDFRTLNFFAPSYKKIISAYENYSGKISGNVDISKNKIFGKFSLSNVMFNHKRLHIPVQIVDTDLIVRKNELILKSLNAKIDSVPVYMDLKVKNIAKTPYYVGYITSNVYPDFVNKYVNANIGYPIKLKNEVRFKADFWGTLDKFRADSLLTIPVGSDISYMGANLGEEEFERSIALDVEFSPKTVDVKQFTFAKYILSQDKQKTLFPYFTLSGIVRTTPHGKFLQNFSFKTFSRCSSKFFNMLFRKSILKQGDFECDLKVNGYLSNPSVLGFVRFRNIDIPLYETVIKDIYADFKQSVIELKTIGMVYNTNIEADAVLQNKLQPPHRIKSLDIKADYLDLNKLFDVFARVKPAVSSVGIVNSGVDLSDYFVPKNFLIDSGKVKADEILVKGFPAKGFSANFGLDNEAVLHVSNVDFSMANGSFTANGMYDFNNNKLFGDCVAKNVDANKFTQLVLNVKNQIYGKLDGTVDFSTVGGSASERLKNLKGNVYFEINDGKMPKLGSLEYLLKAGNLVKSGITGFTINNLIEIVIPIKTGDFATIKGIVGVVDGYAKNIQIYSRGDNLSLYIKGEADLETSTSNMVVYGRLSKNFSSLLGTVGNVSLNTLFNLIPGISLEDADGGVASDLNKIPGIELSKENYRFFNAQINGDLNGDDYVKSFKWFE